MKIYLTCSATAASTFTLYYVTLLHVTAVGLKTLGFVAEHNKVINYEMIFGPSTPYCTMDT